MALVLLTSSYQTGTYFYFINNFQVVKKFHPAQDKRNDLESGYGSVRKQPISGMEGTIHDLKKFDISPKARSSANGRISNSVHYYHLSDEGKAAKCRFLPEWLVIEFKELFSLAWYLVSKTTSLDFRRRGNN